VWTVAWSVNYYIGRRHAIVKLLSFSAKTRKPCCRKETARCRSSSFRFTVRPRHSLQV